MFAETRFRYIKVLFHIVYCACTEVMNIIGWLGLLSFPLCGKKIILNPRGRIARSYELYAGKENFLPSPRSLEGSIEKNSFNME